MPSLEYTQENSEGLQCYASCFLTGEHSIGKGGKETEMLGRYQLKGSP